MLVVDRSRLDLRPADARPDRRSIRVGGTVGSRVWSPVDGPVRGRLGGPSVAPSGGGGAAVVITAANLTFTTPEVSAPASVPFVIDFRNEDAGQPHNVEIKNSSGAQVFMGPIVTGVTQAQYDVPALDPGTYPFICTVHVNMKGTLKVGA